MPSIIIKDTEHFDIGLRKFKRACEKAAIVPEIRAREFYEKPSIKRQRKKAEGIKRHQKKVASQRLSNLPRGFRR